MIWLFHTVKKETNLVENIFVHITFIIYVKQVLYIRILNLQGTDGMFVE
jgi:hypothetical protein